MFGNHICIMGVATEKFDSHLKEVRVIRYIMKLQCIDKEAYLPEMLDYIFWHILMDSRQYLNKFTGKSRSNLSVLSEILSLCVVPAPMNCPIKDLIGIRNNKMGSKE